MRHHKPKADGLGVELPAPPGLRRVLRPDGSILTYDDRRDGEWRPPPPERDRPLEISRCSRLARAKAVRHDAPSNDTAST